MSLQEGREMFAGIGLVKQEVGQIHSDWLWSRSPLTEPAEMLSLKARDVFPKRPGGRPAGASSGQIRHRRH